MANKASNAILAKARAMYGHRLTPEDYEALAACRTLPEVTTYLKNHTVYAQTLAQVNPAFAQRNRLELELHHAYFQKQASLCRYEMSIGQDIYRLFILQADIQQLLTCLRYLDSGRPGDYLFVLPSFLQKHTQLDLYALASVTDFDSLLTALKGTPYYNCLQPLAVSKDDAYRLTAVAAPALNALVYDEVLNLLKHGSSGMKEYYQRWYDLHMLPIIWRTKRMLGAHEEEARKRLRLGVTALPAKTWDKLLQAPDGDTFVEELMSTRYGKEFQSIEWARLDQAAQQLQFNWCKKNLRFSTDPVVVLLCYLELARNEIINITHIIEGVRYGLPKEQILHTLIGVDADAV